MLNQIYFNSQNLVENIKQIKKQNPNSIICAMVKANAYGVGTKFAVKTLAPYVQYFGVATQHEAQNVAKLTNKKILIVGALETRNINNRFSYACHSLEDILALASLNRKVNIHIKINTGMNRYGFSSKKDLMLALEKILNSKLNLEGVFTHFATDDEYVDEQMKVFKSYVNMVKKYGFNPIIHVDNSAVSQKKNHHKAMVRIGFDLYNKTNYYFKPIVSLKSKVVQINECKRGDIIGYNYKYVCSTNKTVAIIPIGYADGFSTSYIGMELNFKGKKCKVLNVCMDCLMLDVTNVKTKKGDEIFIINENNPLKNYANHSNLSEYEVMCNFSHVRAKAKHL